MKTPDIPEAKEGSIATNNGYTYYVDKHTDKVVRIAPDGSRKELPTSEASNKEISLSDCTVSKSFKYSDFFNDEGLSI